jgi:nucleotide-binding universal stress UspA family protein
MFKHVLIPVDGLAGTGQTRQAVAKAALLATTCGSEVSIIYVVDPYAFTGVGADFSYGQAEYLSAASIEGEQALRTTRDVLLAHGLKVNTSLVEGHAIYRGICDTAVSIGADLIVMGSHGRHGIEKLLLGSVTAQVLSHTQVPVLVVRD